MTQQRPVASTSLLDGRVAIITGASGHIGQGIATGFQQAGARCVRQYHRAALPPMAGSSNAAVCVDLTTDSAPDSVVDVALGLAGRIDVLVNVAGIQPVVDLSSMSRRDWDDMIEVNLSAAHRLSIVVAEQMATQDDGGAIIHIASIEGHRPAAGHAHYAVSKAGLLMHARAMALEYGGHGVRVNTVSPGLIDRPGLADDWPDGHRRWLASAPLGRLGQPQDIAAACVFLASPLAGWITGADLVVDGGISARPTW